MDHDTAHWEGFGKIPPQGGPQADVKATPVSMERIMGISPSGGFDGGGGISGDGDLHLLPLEQISTVYCNQAHYVPMSNGAA